MKNLCFFVVLLSITFSNCKQDDKKPLLLGKWQGVSWKVKGKDSGRDVNSISFEFKNDDSYSTAFETQKEHGSFRLVGDKLYTTGENKIEKMVKLSTLKADTIVMDMNRAGDAEELVLVKK